jgi:hypothetical protein
MASLSRTHPFPFSQRLAFLFLPLFIYSFLWPSRSPADFPLLRLPAGPANPWLSTPLHLEDGCRPHRDMTALTQPANRHSSHTLLSRTSSPSHGSHIQSSRFYLLHSDSQSRLRPPRDLSPMRRRICWPAARLRKRLLQSLQACRGTWPLQRTNRSQTQSTGR